MRTKLQQTIHRFLSIRVGKKILLATSISSLLTLSVFSFLYVIHEKNSFLQRKTEHIKTLSIIVASNSEAALSFDDTITANDYLTSLDNDPDISQAILFNRYGELFASFNRYTESPIPSIPSQEGESIGKREVNYVHFIQLHGEKIGTLLIKADISTLNQTIKTAIFKAIQAIAFGTFLSVLIAFVIQRLIARPLFELEVFAKNVTDDDDYSLRATKRYDDEIGSLVDSINTMVSHAQKRKDLIQNHNRTLENKVSVRTEELRKAMERAKAASQAKSEFLSTMSHELRTPLNAIVGMSGVIANDDISPELADHVRIIQNSSDSLLAIINQILDYSKIESGHLELEHRTYNLAECIEESMDMISSVHWEKPVDFFTTLDPQLPGIVTGDITRVRQVLVNLIGNASKFTKKGHIWVHAECTQHQGKPELKISVQDTGIGIPADRINKLFKTFSQIDSSTTREFGGTGLGLAITKKLVNAMGGEITVTSEENQGTIFSFTLPNPNTSEKTLSDTLRPQDLKPNTSIFLSIPFAPLRKSLTGILENWGINVQAEDASSDLTITTRFHSYPASSTSESNKPLLTLLHPQKQSLVKSGVQSVGPLSLREIRNFVQQGHQNTPKVEKTPKQVTHSQLPSKSTRILLAEDNKVNQKVFKLMMKREGYSNLDIANNGLEAVAAINKTPYEIIFMDLQMPEMDGLTACQTIRDNSDIKQPWIIGFTANVESDAKPAMQKVGMNDYLSKPVKNELLLDSLAKYMNNSHTNLIIKNTSN